MRKLEVVFAVVALIATATSAAAQPHRQVATVATPPGADLTRYPVHRFKGAPAQIAAQCRAWGKDHGLREMKIGRSWTGWNFHEEVEGGRFVFETLAAEVEVLVDAAGNSVYKVDCCNRLQEAVEPTPPPPPAKVEVVREKDGNVSVTVNVTNANTNTITLPPAEPKPATAAPPPPPPPAAPQSNRQLGVTGGFMPGRFSSRPLAGTIESVSDWLVCIDGRTWNAGVALGTPGRHFRFTLGQTIVADRSFTRRRADDGTEVVAEARDVKVTGPRVGYAIRFAEHWPVSPYLSGSIGVGKVTGQVLRTRFNHGSTVTDTTDGGRLLNADWLLLTGAGVGLAGQKGDFAFAFEVAGFENPGVFWRGSAQITYWPGSGGRRGRG